MPRFIDQGFATWPLVNRDSGFFQSFCKLFGTVSGLSKPWAFELGKELSQIAANETTPIESIRHSLEQLGVARDQWEDFICQSLLALRGFAGMLWQLECRSDRASRAVPDGTLIEFLAVRLVLDRHAAAFVAKQAGYEGALAEMAPWLIVRSTKKTGNVQVADAGGVPFVRTCPTARLAP